MKRIIIYFNDNGYGYWMAIDTAIVNPVPLRFVNGYIDERTSKNVIAYAEYNRNHKVTWDAKEYVISAAKKYCERNNISLDEIEIQDED